MSETTPPVPKSGGSGPFILAAIVMLLLMGGLIYWKMKSGSDETAKVQAPKSTAVPEQPVLDEPPPPSIALALASPARMSLNAEPVRFSKPETVSFPAPPVAWAVAAARLAVTDAAADA